MSKSLVSRGRPERAVLVYVNDDDAEDTYVEEELEGLCEAANVEVVGSLRQRLDSPVRATFLGKGKLEELAVVCREVGAEIAIFDGEVSGIQQRNLEDAIKTRVVDRTQLILDIFAKRARTREGMLQVELAQLTTMLPKLMAVYTKFERQKGGIGMRGPGETKLESDRRLVRDRISRLSDELEEVKRHRSQQRASRRKHPFPFATIAGYTSAGKSTLMNRLAGTDLLADAMPFATLDPTTRKIDLPDGYSLFLTDTVGFIRNLPTSLVAAFRSTLEEVTFSDFIIHVVDVSHEGWELQHEAVMETLAELGAAEKPVLTVLNKVDLLVDPNDAFSKREAAEYLTGILDQIPNSVAISAFTGEGVPEFLRAVLRQVQDLLGFVKALVPYSESGLVQDCYDYGRVLVADYREDGIYVEAELVSEMRSKLDRYKVCD
ncbi:MAG TPA: GTPase HflX [Fimbriimonadaceae bacterium]|nr:GTPase HflX [Fimbriimonadaceae bacterium]